MNAAQINVVNLQFIAVVLAAILTVAWRNFARPQHAAVWACAYVVAFFAWATNFVMLTYFAANPYFFTGIAILTCTSNALIAIGYMQRAGQAKAWIPIYTALMVAVIALILSAFVIHHRGLRDAAWLCFSGGMLAISAANVTRSIRTATTPERATVVMLVLFAALDFVSAGMALRQGADGQGGGLEAFRLTLILLYPPAFVGVGLTTVFLVSADLAERMRSLAVSDLLTGIFNRRGFEEAAERAIRNAQRQRQPLALVVTDIDRFKAVNDRFGHNAGDRAIKHFATRMERMVRRGDLVGRVGGEEFALLLINTSSNDALDVVERIRRDVAAMPVAGPEGISLTASFGVTGLRPGDTSLASMFARADRALYRSKVEGRDRVTCAEVMEEMAGGAKALTPGDVA